MKGVIAMITMVIEATPQQVIALTSIPFAIAVALAVALYIGVEWRKFRTKMPSSILGILSASTFAVSLMPWAVLAEEFGLGRIPIIALCALGIIILLLCIRIRYSAKKPTRRFPVSADMPLSASESK